MRRILTYSLLVLTLLGGVAAADRDHRRDRRDDRRGDRRDHRDHRRDDRRDRRDDRRHDHNRGGVVVRNNNHHNHRPYNHNRRVVNRNRVYVNNGRYVFHGGVSRPYVRPVIRHRYFDVRVRPTVVVENYDPVPGYIWVSGSWNWNGYEWVWTSGHFAPDTRYSVWYDDGSYDY